MSLSDKIKKSALSLASAGLLGAMLLTGCEDKPKPKVDTPAQEAPKASPKSLETTISQGKPYNL